MNDKMDSSNTEGSVLFRVDIAVPDADVTFSGYSYLANTFYAQLQSKILERNVLIPIMCYNNVGFITITAANIPKNVNLIKFVRRNLTRREKKFSEVKKRNGSIAAWSATNSDKSFTFRDYNIKDEDVYEYKAQISYGTGEVFNSLNSFVIEYLKLNKQIAARFSSPSNDSVIHHSGYVFSVAIDKAITPADTLFDIVAGWKNDDMSTGMNPLFETFSAQFEEINYIIGRATVVDVVRYDMLTGERVYAGRHNANYLENSSTSSIADIVDPNTSVSGRTYIYEATPLTKTLFAMFVEIKTYLKEIVETAEDPDQNLVIQALTSFEEAVASSVGNKFYTRDCYNKGTIQAPFQYVEQVGGDMWQYGRCGNKIYFTRQTSSQQPSIESSNITLIKTIESVEKKYCDLFFGNNFANQSNELNSRITKFTSQNKANYIENTVLISMSFSNATNVDFGVITCIKNNVKRIVGSFHVTPTRITYLFLDPSQSNYEGLVTYYVSLVLENKEVFGPVMLGNIKIEGK